MHGHCAGIPVRKQPGSPAAEAFRLKTKEVEIFRGEDEIVLREKDGTMVRAFDLLAGLPDDLELGGREQDPPQKRKGL